MSRPAGRDPPCHCEPVRTLAWQSVSHDTAFPFDTSKTPRGLVPSGCRKAFPAHGGKAPSRRQWRIKRGRLFRSGRKSRGSAQARRDFRAPQGGSGDRSACPAGMRWMRSPRSGFWIQLCRVRWGEEPSPVPFLHA